MLKIVFSRKICFFFIKKLAFYFHQCDYMTLPETPEKSVLFSLLMYILIFTLSRKLSINLVWKLVGGLFKLKFCISGVLLAAHAALPIRVSTVPGWTDVQSAALAPLLSRVPAVTTLILRVTWSYSASNANVGCTALAIWLKPKW